MTCTMSNTFEAKDTNCETVTCPNFRLLVYIHKNCECVNAVSVLFFCFFLIIIADGIVVVKMKESEDSKSAGEVGIDTYYYYPLL